jgi:hypothetical protein
MIPEGPVADNARRGLRGLLALGLALAACSTREVEIPDLSGPSEASGPFRVVVGGTPAPSASPSPSSEPGPGPTPTPPPTPSASCPLPPGGGDGRGCPRESPSFLGDVSGAIDALVAARPELFDTGDARCGNCYKVRDEGAFVAALVDAVMRRGLCATYDGEELAVKRTNDFNDQYDVLTADGYLRRGEGSYTATCRPAWF